MSAEERPIAGAAGLFGIARVERAPWRRGLAAVAVLYALTGCIALVLLPRLPANLSSLPDWIAVPPQLLAMAVSARLAGHPWDTRGYPRRLWLLIGAFCAMSLVATYAWNEWRVRGGDRVLSVADLCYFVDYAFLSAAYRRGFQRYGGRLLSLRTSLDALTILVALLGTFWATLLGPFSPSGQSQPMGLLFGGAYAVSISVMLTLALLLFQRLPRRHRMLAVDAWILVGFVALAACLLTTRQLAVRREVTELNRAIALRAANDRVTELVRESADAFLVVDRHGIVQFASPASERILRRCPRRARPSSSPSGPTQVRIPSSGWRASISSRIRSSGASRSPSPT